MTAAPTKHGCIGVVIPDNIPHGFELVGDAADLAQKLKAPVAVCTTHIDISHHRDLIEQGADCVTLLEQGNGGPNHRLASVESWISTRQPRVVFVSASGDDRALAARLAVRCGLRLVSPTLSASLRGQNIEIIGLNADGCRARTVKLVENEAAIVAMRPGVGQARSPDVGRSGEINRLTIGTQTEVARTTQRLPADPTMTDIVHLPRLVAGGRGLGGREGFEFLKTVATRLQAGIAASRMAVDLGWIERERQVGQTGKTVKPELYLACGISGASHHREGMADSRHVIALNVDPAAPIFQIAHLGLVADWQETLRHFLELTQPSPNNDRQVR